MIRRDFLQFCALSLLSPQLFAHSRHKQLILVELSGGNDTLNTVVPYNDKLYFKYRQHIALPKTLPISPQLSLNPNLTYLKKLFDKGELAIVNGLGYPEPNRSHFRSIEIVETASLAQEYLSSGWINKAIKNRYDIDAIIVGKNSGTSLFSDQLKVINFLNANQFLKKSKRFKEEYNRYNNEALQFILKNQSFIFKANKLLTATLHNINIKTPFAKTAIAKDFKEAAKIVASGLNVGVIKLTQGGYDTHTYQVNKHNRLLRELDGAIESFVKEMRFRGLYDDVMVMTYSEFGRRVMENGSKGTDHGTAASHFVIGGKTKGGLYGEYPSLDNLDDNNDLQFTTHFKSYYNTFIKNYFNNPNTYKSYKPLGFI